MKLKSKQIVAFDIGSSKIAALAAVTNKYGEAYVNTQIVRSSEGFKAGTITDIKSAEESFVSTIYELENDLDKSINEISLSISGAGLKSYYLSQKTKLSPNNPVSKQDIKKLVQKTIAEFNVPGMEILHYFPLEYVLDGEDIVDNPLDMYASELSLQLHIIAANSSKLLNLTKCLARCHVEVSQVVAASYAAGMAVLSDDEKKLGAVVVDFGAHVTSFAVFMDGKCIFVGSVPIGSSHITADIAREFSVSLETAEKLKILHSAASPDLLVNKQILRAEDFEDSSSYDTDTSIRASDIAAIVEKRLSEIFIRIKKEYDDLHLENLIAKRMVVTGGGANLHGLSHFLGRIFGMQVRIARPIKVDGFVDQYSSNIFSTLVGMIKIEADKAKARGADVLGVEEGIIKRTFSWIKENI